MLTACAWVNGEVTSFAIISDYMGHDKYITMLCLFTLITDLRRKYPGLANLDLFSDGACQHFKQCYTLNGVSQLNSQLGTSLNISYSFFATAHGKGNLEINVITKNVIVVIFRCS